MKRVFRVLWSMPSIFNKSIFGTTDVELPEGQKMDKEYVEGDLTRFIKVDADSTEAEVLSWVEYEK